MTVAKPKAGLWGAIISMKIGLKMITGLLLHATVGLRFGFRTNAVRKNLTAVQLTKIAIVVDSATPDDYLPLLMLRLGHKLVSAFQQLRYMLRTAGPVGALSIIFFRMDDKYLRSFDRRFGVKTSGFLYLSETGFDSSRLPDATQYAPVSGWGFRKFLRRSGIPKNLRFVDLGCGLGRACLLAAEYGFAKVTGVELAP